MAGKLDQLIAELCSNGVEYKKLREVATISRGGSFQKKDYVENGFPCIHYGQIYTLYELFVEETANFISDEVATKQKKAVTNDIIMAVTSENIEDVCKCVAWLGNGEVAVSGHTAIIHHTLDPKYMVYYLHSSMFYSQKVKLAHGTKVIEVKPDSLGEIKLPVPPLEVQREIVRVLDNFTFLTAELTAELKARRKQYEYYRNKILSSNKQENTKDISVGDVCNIITDYVAAGSFADIAKNVQYKSEPNYAQLVRTVDIKSNFTKSDPVFVNEQAFHFLWRVNLDKECIILPNIGVNCGEVYFIKPEKLPYANNVLGPNAIMVRSSTENNRFLSYIFQCPDFQSKLRKIISPGGQTKFNKTEFKKIKLQLPPLYIQNRVVNILDKFDTVCNDISIGLPAEIAARQKQYEYYRDKLLAFKELNA